MVPPDRRWFAGSSLISGRTLAALFAICAAALAAAILVPERLPFVDFPQHVAMLARWTHAGDPAWGVPGQFRVELLTPYMLGYALAYLLAPILGDETAMRVVLLVAVIGLPASAYALLRVFDRPGALALLAFPVAMSWAVFMGFFPYIVAMPIIILAVAQARRVAVSGRPRDVVLLGAISIVLLAAHAFAFAVGAGICMLVAAAGGGRRVAALGSVVLALAPATALTVIWFLLRGAAVHPEPRSLAFGSPLRRVDMLAALFGSADRDPRVIAVALGAFIVVAAAAVMAYRERPMMAISERTRAWMTDRRALLLPGLGAAFACFVAPVTAFDAYGLWQRIAPTAFVLVLGLLPWPSRGAVQRRLVLGAAVVAFLAGSTALVQGMAFSNAAAGLHDVLAVLPPGQRLYYEAPLDAMGSTGGIGVRAFRHMGAYYVAERGGSLDYDFARFPFQVIVATSPGSFREPMGTFDLYLFRASATCPAPPADRPVGRLLASVGDWRAFEVAHDPTTPGPIPYDLPCAPTAPAGSPQDEDNGP